MSMESGPRPEVAKVETGNDIEKEITDQEAMLDGNVAALNERYAEVFEVLKNTEKNDSEEVGDDEYAQLKAKRDRQRRILYGGANASIEELIEGINMKFKERLITWPASVGGSTLIAFHDPATSARLTAVSVGAAAAIWGIQRIKLLIQEVMQSKETQPN